MTKEDEKKLSDVLDLAKIKVVTKPIAESHGLPNECYMSDDYAKIERKKLFEEKWSVIGVASSTPNPGDIRPFDLLDVPLIVLRDKNNKIRVFHNVCSHRGFKLVQQSEKLKKFIRCPYHSWSYDLEGELISTPHIGGVGKHESGDFDKSCNGLKEVRSYV